MSASIRDYAFEAPIHVMQCADGRVRLLLPDGHSITLSAEAAARSAQFLTRVSAHGDKRKRRERARGRGGRFSAAEIIPVDFAHGARL